MITVLDMSRKGKKKSTKKNKNPKKTKNTVVQKNEYYNIFFLTNIDIFL